MLEVGERVSLLLVVTMAVHEICTHIDWDCQWGLRSTIQVDSNLDLIIIHLGLRSRGRQTCGGDMNLWLVQIWASLCVACEIVLRAVRALCYLLLHVIYHYNIQIVGGFQLYAFPITYCVICVLDYVLMTASISAYWWSIVEEVMYYAWSLNSV